MNNINNLHKRRKRVAIIGSTGSIGKQALDVISRHPEMFEVTALAAYSSAAELEKQTVKFRPKTAVLIAPPENFVPEETGVKWAFGEEARNAICADPDVDDVLISVVGMAGLSAVLTCIKYKKRILLANKETLMAGGELVMSEANKNGVEIIPVDSEHTAIYQCLLGRGKDEMTKILLTASGGPFRTWSRERIRKATPEDALKHPNWSMGRKITIDSATMMNKSIEIVEAHFLFGAPPEKIEVVVHPQSIVHSAVEFSDGGIMANLSVPDMRIPILYALSGGSALDAGAKKLSLFDMPGLEFFRCDTEVFPLVKLAYDSLKMGGNACIITNAANEVAVDAFLSGEIALGGIIDTIFASLDELFAPEKLDFLGILEQDARARLFAADFLKKMI